LQFTGNQIDSIAIAKQSRRNVAALGRRNLAQAVHRLGAALDCRPATVGAMTEFDRQTAYGLQRALLARQPPPGRSPGHWW